MTKISDSDVCFSDQNLQEMAKRELQMPLHPSGKVVGTQTSQELWVGFLGHVPLVGTSANMVDGFISLLQGDTKTAEAKGYKDFLDAVGIHDLEPRSIFQSPINQTVIGCSAKLSKKITDYILDIADQKSQAKTNSPRHFRQVKI
ncbi:hypothetical protein GJAV_G00037970 [Gymnothorax javanicus]|nr:hypothetical protein GJAV_G00037970 [Gymnothorax javanicus]